MSKKFFCEYKTPNNFDNMIMVSDGDALNALVFENSPDMTQKFMYGAECENCINVKDKIEKNDNLEVFVQTKKWLDIYFGGGKPNFIPKLYLALKTEFCSRVSEIIKKIPYGKTITYGEIAKRIADENGIKKMSAQAVGKAVGSNPVCIIIPCHRVLGAGGKITGYGGGIKNKIELLRLEGVGNIHL